MMDLLRLIIRTRLAPLPAAAAAAAKKKTLWRARVPERERERGVTDPNGLGLQHVAPILVMGGGRGAGEAVEWMWV